MYIGIDLGTSSVKAVAMADDGSVVAEASEPLDVSRPSPKWSEQNPHDWWRATEHAVARLPADHRRQTRSIGLSGQMHGAVLLDATGEPLRAAILWNDGRADAECTALEEAVDVHDITGNRAMPGFTAPKLDWVAKHEPAIFAATKKVLLPKDYLRFRMTGEFVSDMSDASGTLWLDVSKRAWSDEMLAATSLERDHMPRLVEGSAVTGALRDDVARAWGMDRVPVVGGAGDQAAGAIGVGAIAPGMSFVSLGTSGVFFTPDDGYHANPDGGVHAFCHALPGRWHQMSVILSAASALSWIAGATGAESEAALIDEIEATGREPGALFFLPYLSGERTPHNDPNALGTFVGISHETTRADLGRAVLEGVAFALRDGQDVLAAAGATFGDVSVIGGGSRSRFWGSILAAVLGRSLSFRRDAAVGPALGAARLAAIGAGGAVDDVCRQAPVEFEVEASEVECSRATERFTVYRDLYLALRDEFTKLARLG